MELNFTGKGSAFYPPFKNTGAYMLSGKALYLIDCGETMFDVLYHKLDLASIEDVYVILTHMHADHVGSLGTLISYFYCLFNKAIHVVYPQETIKQLLTLEGITPLGYHYHETLPENPAGLTAVPVEVKHALDMKCYGYVLSDGTETIYYSSPQSIRRLLPSQRAIIAVSQRYGSGIIPPVPSKQISNINRLTSFHLMLIS